MLCPEVWNFKEPASSFKTAVKCDGNLTNLGKLSNFYYNHLVSVILPDSLKVPQTLTDKLILDCEYYRIDKLNVKDLVEDKFLTCFVKSGKLTLLSINSRIDCDNCLAVTPNGHLILNIDKESYQTLGLEGKVSHFHQKTKSRYLIDIHLTSDTFKPGKPFYKRVQKCLEKLNSFSIILNWTPPDEKVCPSSIAKYLSMLQYDVKVCKPKYQTSTVYSVKVPDFDLNSYDEETLAEFVEWLGMITVKGDFLEDPDNYLSSYVTPEPNSELGQVKCLTWRGLFNFEQITEFTEELKAYVKRENKSWVAVYVQGFSDASVSWNLEEHHYYTNGDNGYVVILNSTNCIVSTQECSRKVYK